MEFEAKLDDQISAPAETAAAALQRTGTASKALDAQLRKLDVAQQRTARSKQAQAKAFDPAAYQKQIKAEEELRKAKESALEGLGMGLSQKEKDAKRKTFDPAAYEAEIRADRELSAAKENSLRKLGLGLSQREKDSAKAEEKKYEKQKMLMKGAAAAVLAVGAAGLAAAVKLAPIAIGYRGMARLEMISYKASLNLRGLFKGVDSKPLERSFSRLTDMINVTNPSGRQMSELLTRGFNGIFKAVERIEPYVEALGQGLILAAALGENAFARLEMATLPVTLAMEDVTGKIDMMTVVAYGTAGVIGAIGLAAGVAAVAVAALAVPFVALGAAIYYAYKAGKALVGSEWFKNAGAKVVGWEMGSAKAEPDTIGPPTAGAQAAAQSLQASAGQASGGGKAALEKSGGQTAQGFIDGILAYVSQAEMAGAALPAAVDRGVRAKAEIHSPSKMMHRNALFMDEGAEEGFDAGAPGVQKAAERALVPELPSSTPARPSGGAAAGAQGGATAGGERVNHFDFSGAFSGAVFGSGVNAGDVQAQIEEAVARLAQVLAARMGVS